MAVTSLPQMNCLTLDEFVFFFFSRYAKGQAKARLGFLPIPGYSQIVNSSPEDNRDLVALTFRSLDAGFSRGGKEVATSVLQEAFARRIRDCLIDLPSPEELKELPEELQQEVQQRQRDAAVLRQKREAALHIVPDYSRLLQEYRAYDEDMGSPKRLARYLGISATTVLVGGALGYLVEQWGGLPYATLAGIGLGLVAFFSMMLQTLGTSRQMTRVESAHAAALDKLRQKLFATFEAVDARQPPGTREEQTS